MSWITIALWMLPLGHVQAWPLGSMDQSQPSDLLNQESLGFQLLKEVSCGRDLNFTSPTNVKVMCYDAALGHFIQQFQQALGNCNDENDHIPQTLEELERLYSQTQRNCTLAVKDHDNFADYVDAATEFVEKYNNAQYYRIKN